MSLAAGYVIGIGSNIEPECNVPRILHALLDAFGALRMSRVLRTRPVGMASQADFLNLAVFVETGMDAGALKSLCNRIETGLGRDRNDPDSARKDRPADLDILFRLGGDAAVPPLERVDGAYLRPAVADVYALLGLADPGGGVPGMAVRLGEASAGEVPAAVHLDCRTGHVVVVEQRA